MRRVKAYARAAYLRQRLFLKAGVTAPLPRGVSAANACFNGFWLGLFDRESLSRLDEHFFESAALRTPDGDSSYVDDEWNLSGLQPWEAEFVSEDLQGSRRVVVTGAGGGREVLALLEAGFDAVGYEPHPQLAATGARFLERRGYGDGRLRRSGRDAFPEDVESCDAVLVGWGSYMLTPGSRRRIAFLRAARERVTEGAPILLSFFVRPDDRRFLRIVRTTANVLRRARREEPVELGDVLDAHYVHYFTREEVERELAAAGFRLTAFETAPYGHAVGRAARLGASAALT